jgi:hypothetical protein
VGARRIRKNSFLAHGTGHAVFQSLRW